MTRSSVQIVKFFSSKKIKITAEKKELQEQKDTQSVTKQLKKAGSHSTAKESASPAEEEEMMKQYPPRINRI
jgi:hypothetical protein